MSKLHTYLNELTLRAYVRLQLFAAQEPVRLRAALTSVVLAAAIIFPAINAGTAETVGAVGAIALPVLIGESARNRVTPV